MSEHRNESSAATLAVGDHVRHFMSGWTGIVSEIGEQSAAGQGRLVTVDPVYAGGKIEGAVV